MSSDTPPALPPTADCPDPDGTPVDISTLLAEARATAAARLAQAREEDLEHHRLFEQVAAACLEALNEGLGRDEDLEPLPDVEGWAKVGRVIGGISTHWMQVEALPVGVGVLPVLRCLIPLAAIVIPDQDRQRTEMLTAFLEGRPAQEPVSRAITVDQLARLEELAVARREWEKLVLACAGNADDAGRVQLTQCEPEGPYWDESFRTLRAIRQVNAAVTDLHGETAVLTAGAANTFGTIDWATLLLFDPTSPLYDHYKRHADTKALTSRLRRRRDAALAARERHDVNERARAMLRELRGGEFGFMPDGVGFNDSPHAGPSITFPPQDRTRQGARLTRLFIDPDRDRERWIAELSDGTQAASRVRTYPSDTPVLAGLLHDATDQAANPHALIR